MLEIKPAKCQELRNKHRELKNLKAEFDFELEQAAMTKKFDKVLALKNKLELAYGELKTDVEANTSEISDKQWFDYLKKQIESGRELSVECLKFLYKQEICEHYGLYKLTYEEKDYLNDVRAQREVKHDYAKIYGVRDEQVIEKMSEINDDTMVYCGKTYSGRYSYVLPKVLGVDKIKRLMKIKHLPIDCTYCDQSIKDQISECQGTIIDKGDEIIYPALHSVHGSLLALCATRATLPNLKIVKNTLNLQLIKLTAGLNLHQSTVLVVNLQSLESAAGLKLPQRISLNLNLIGLKSAAGLDLSRVSIGGNIIFGALPDQECAELQKQYPNLKIIKI